SLRHGYGECERNMYRRHARRASCGIVRNVRIVRTGDTMTTNADLIDRTLRAVWHPCTQMKLHERLPMVPVSHGKGSWLYDFEGHRSLDAISSWWVNLFGHANERINAAVAQQMEELEHVILAGFSHTAVVELSER